MMGKTIAILGGGFGGVAVAHELRERLSQEHRIVVIDKSPTFSMGLSNLWVMTGERSHPREGERSLNILNSKGIRYLNEEILWIDPAKRQVKTSTTVIDADYLVISLGAQLAPQDIKGFAEVAYNLYDAYDALRLQQALREFHKGTIAILIARTPFKCPAAPYEAAFLLDAYFRRLKIRDKVEINLYTPEDQPMPVAGPKVGGVLRGMLDERGIGYFPEYTVLKVDADSKRLLFEVDEADFDLLIGIPPHVAPPVVREAGLLGPTGWIPVDGSTLQSRFPNIYAIGDVTAIKLRNGMFLPKAGVFAEAQGIVVADRISTEVKGGESSSTFTGEGYCYLEVGNGLAALGAGNFYASPSPDVKLEPPSAEYRREKQRFESSRLEKWLQW